MNESANPLSGLEFCPRCGSGPRQVADTVECPDCGRPWAGPRLLGTESPAVGRLHPEPLRELRRQLEVIAHRDADVRAIVNNFDWAAGEIAPPAPSQQREIRLLTCKQCGCSIDDGLCGYDCPCDGDVASARNPGDMEVRIYQFVRSEPPAPPQAPEHSKESQ